MKLPVKIPRRRVEWLNDRLDPSFEATLVLPSTEQQIVDNPCESAA